MLNYQTFLCHATCLLSRFLHWSNTSAVGLEELQVVVRPAAGDDVSLLLAPVDAHDLVLVALQVVQRRPARPPVPHLYEL